MSNLESKKMDTKYGVSFNTIPKWSKVSDVAEFGLSHSSPWRQIDEPQRYLPKRWFTFCNTTAVNSESYGESCQLLAIDRPEKRNPLTQEDLLDGDDEQIIELILRLTLSLPFSYRDDLANSLLTLFHDAKEEDPTCPGISVGSLRYFYNFLQLHTNLKCPTISLTPEYNIYASWRDDQKRVFSVHFLPNGDVRFVIFKPNKSHPEKQVRFSGIATTDILMDEVSLTGELDWVSE